MTELEDALETLKDRLGGESCPSSVVADTADEYEVHPGFLRRKFEERYSVSPEAYMPTESLKTLFRRRARKIALNTAWSLYSAQHTINCRSMEEYAEFQKRKDKWIAEQIKDCHLGAFFVDRGREYAFAGVSMMMPPHYGVMAILVEGDDTLQTGVSPEFLALGMSDLQFPTKLEADDWLQKRIVIGGSEKLN